MATLNHELKNQLGIILGFAELLLEDMSADDARRPDVEEIHAAATRALTLVKSIPQPVSADSV